MLPAPAHCDGTPSDGRGRGALNQLSCCARRSGRPRHGLTGRRAAGPRSAKPVARAFTDQPCAQQVLEIGIDDEGPTSEAHVLAIADFIRPIGFSWLSAPAAGSTLTWMLELLADRFDHLPLSGFRIEANLIAARDDYTNRSVSVFAASGEPLALGHQTMLVFG